MARNSAVRYQAGWRGDCGPTILRLAFPVPGRHLSPALSLAVHSPESESRPRPAAALAAAVALLALLGLAAYSGTLGVPFHFDDASAVLGNASIRQLWPLARVLCPPPEATVAGRPLLNLSFALNYAAGGVHPAGYHATNLAIHVLAGLVLFGLVRRTLRRRGRSDPYTDDATLLAFAIAAVWMLHPIQTSSVTYVSQRAEALMGLCYLLVLYAFVRRVDSPHPGRWDLAAISAGLLGAACKEVIMTAPVIVLLYDRTFVTGSFREAWRRHARLYAGLAGIWVLLAVQLAGGRGQAFGYGQGLSAWAYLVTEGEVVLRYLGLAVWPHPLVFDYGEDWSQTGLRPLMTASTVVALVAISLRALARRPWLGFLGAWFFIILSPTSSLVPIAHQPMAENRLYLPLVAVVIGVLVGLYAAVGRRWFPLWAAGLIIGLGLLTLQRNADYQDEVGLWRDTVNKRPGNARAQYNLGHALAADGRTAEAARAYASALELKPSYAEAHHNLGNALARLGQPLAAISHYEAAIRLEPGYASAEYNLGSTQAEMGHLPDAIRHFEAALRLEPGAAGVHHSLGSALARAGRPAEAMQHYAEAVRLSPAYPEAQTNWGNLLAQSGRWTEATAHYEAALKTDPDYPEAHINLGNARLQLQQPDEAAAHYEAALRRDPQSAAAHYNLGNLGLARGELSEAIGHYEAALRTDPTLAGAHHNLALALVRQGRAADALPHYEETLRLFPRSAAAHHNLSTALEQLSRASDAIAHEEEALRLQPDFAEAQEHLAQLRRR